MPKVDFRRIRKEEHNSKSNEQFQNEYDAQNKERTDGLRSLQRLNVESCSHADALVDRVEMDAVHLLGVEEVVPVLQLVGTVDGVEPYLLPEQRVVEGVVRRPEGDELLPLVVKPDTVSHLHVRGAVRVGLSRDLFEGEVEVVAVDVVGPDIAAPSPDIVVGGGTGHLHRGRGAVRYGGGLVVPERRFREGVKGGRAGREGEERKDTHETSFGGGTKGDMSDAVRQNRIPQNRPFVKINTQNSG